MNSKEQVVTILLIILLLTFAVPASGTFTIKSGVGVYVTLTGYNGVTETTLFEGELESGIQQPIETLYNGLALLVINNAQRYPVIIDNDPFLIELHSPAAPPKFHNSKENSFFYSLLSGEEAGTETYEFPLLMFGAKKLMDSTSTIKTVKDLQAKKEQIHTFVRTHYQDLAHSEMLRRLIAQYFMMHEYVNYHVAGAPATDIRKQYHKAIINGVGSWLDVLQEHIPEHEVLNYIVSLYYPRSMVTMASRIIDAYSQVAYCPGKENLSFTFPQNTQVTDSTLGNQWKLKNFNSQDVIAFVSDDCHVSKVKTITLARRLAASKSSPKIIVAPLQPLSQSHLNMSKMIAGGKLLFINDEQWQNNDLMKKIKLPLFTRLQKHTE